MSGRNQSVCGVNVWVCLILLIEWFKGLIGDLLPTQPLSKLPLDKASSPPGRILTESSKELRLLFFKSLVTRASWFTKIVNIVERSSAQEGPMLQIVWIFQRKSPKNIDAVSLGKKQHCYQTSIDILQLSFGQRLTLLVGYLKDSGRWYYDKLIFTLVVALEHSRVLAIFCSTVFTSDHPSTMCTLNPLNTRVVWSENHATFNREYSRVLECHLYFLFARESSSMVFLVRPN